MKNLNDQLGELLNRNFNIEGDHEARVVQLIEIKTLEEAVRATDNHRHTGDCDWVITLSIDNGNGLREIPSDPASGEEVTSWGILSSDNESEINPFTGNFTACVDHELVKSIYIWFTNEDGDQEKIIIPLDHLIAITFELT